MIPSDSKWARATREGDTGRLGMIWGRFQVFLSRFQPFSAIPAPKTAEITKRLYFSDEPHLKGFELRQKCEKGCNFLDQISTFFGYFRRFFLLFLTFFLSFLTVFLAIFDVISAIFHVFWLFLIFDVFCTKFWRFSAISDDFFACPDLD